MFNDLTNISTLLATRRSGKARDMIAPGPDAAQLKAILEAAIRVPDHGKLAPWRFIIVGDDQRAALSTLLTEAYKAEKPDAGRLEIEAMVQFAHQAPTLIVALSTPVAQSKVPLWEQQLSTGAACMNFLIAAHAHGFVGNWLTGWPAYSNAVRAAFGAETDQIAGFFFVGTPTRELEERPRPDYAAIVSVWNQPKA
jgi:nitroreductase